MKKLICVLTVVLGMMAFTSCSKENKFWYVGDWSCQLIVGRDDLTEIKRVIITSKNITMKFEDGYYGYLYKQYGSSHTVKYTYNANDETLDGQKMASLTFDEPLYFVNYASVGKTYVSKVFITGGSHEITMSDEEFTHGFCLSK